MSYLFVSDCLWYLGHILTGSSVIFSRKYESLAIAVVIVGQFITIVSRPIGRIQTHPLNQVAADDAQKEDIV